MRTKFNFIDSFDAPFDREALASLAGDVDAANERMLDLVVDANRRLADFAVTVADRVAEALPVSAPFADNLPTPAESAERYIDFVERAAAANREFNQRILARLTADVDTVVGTISEPVAPKATAKKAPATKATAKKSVAKKAAARKATAKKSAATSANSN